MINQTLLRNATPIEQVKFAMCVAQDAVGHKTVSDDFCEFVDAAIEAMPPTNGNFSERIE